MFFSPLILSSQLLNSDSDPTILATVTIPQPPIHTLAYTPIYDILVYPKTRRGGRPI